MLSSMYLCKPSREAVTKWKEALAEDSSIFLAGLKKSINDIDVASEEEMESILWDYTRLFIGPYKLPCPPWESVYTSPKRLMMQDAADQVRRLYGEAGLAISSVEVMPDHIGAELNFLALLLSRIESGSDNKEVCMSIAEGFLKDHLQKWAPDFAADMGKAAETPLYRALAATTKNMLHLLER